MKIYTETYRKSIEKAKELSEFHGGDYAAKSSILCPHGRPSCCIVFSKQYKILYTVIGCEKCLAISKGEEVPRYAMK